MGLAFNQITSPALSILNSLTFFLCFQPNYLNQAGILHYTTNLNQKPGPKDYFWLWDKNFYPANLRKNQKLRAPSKNQKQPEVCGS
jgi:hypothetical protein